MKKIILTFVAVAFAQFITFSQDYGQQLAERVVKLDRAKSVDEYQILANDFIRLANSPKADWKASYYAAFCNAKIGWLYQENPDKIEPFAKLSEQQIKKAESFLDASTQKKALSEVYVVTSMMNRAKVFINPMVNGRKFGPISQKFQDMAEKLYPENPRATYLDAWVKFYTPKMWGGDKEKGKELAQTALELLDKEPDSNTDPHWGKSECEAILKAYDKH
ncbi:hypothetical protein [Galbibacter pacificus]|uniref:Uncharacterized protein n=1 Tax=Galbibacter pacificus TaxID=2996052 RepID=A0ABT6FRF0_9FLAO|nr:hypothetical protein [Galbibacter pacificus]MDG3581845.1 hypothetical protein [Galbibacter pacificus]MDG3585681.1 hypothetical protein [Galbibacter pacificus]